MSFKNASLISIVIPTFNRGHLLTKTLDSIISQSFQNWECIIIDDNSSDDTNKIVHEYIFSDKRFRYFKNNLNQGVSYARNLGLSIANGEYIYFIDSDDIIAKDSLKVKVEYLNQNPTAQIAYTGARYFYNNNIDNMSLYGHDNLLIQVEITKHDDPRLSVFLRNPLVIGTALYRKKVFDKIGNFDSNLLLYEDWDFNIRCAKADIRFHYLGFQLNTCTYIRIHELSLISKSKAGNIYFEKILRKHNEILIFSHLKNSNNISVKSFCPPFVYYIIRKIFNYFKVLCK